MESVHVLNRIDLHRDPRHVDLLRRGLLDQDRAHPLIPVQPLDQGEQLLGGAACQKPVILGFDAHFLRVALLQLDVLRRSRIVTDENSRQPRTRAAARHSLAHRLLDLGVNLFGDGPAVE